MTRPTTSPACSVSRFSLTAMAVAFALVALSACAHAGKPVTATADSDMILIPAGPFLMGTSHEDTGDDASKYGLPYIWYSDATPEHLVYLPAYYIDKYEMTNAQYLRFLNETELPLGDPYGWENHQPPADMGNYPVTGLNWYEAYLACQSVGKRLPSETEWEKAARGTDGRYYPWGDTFDPDKANVATGKAGHLMPVGSFPEGASPYGVMDMVGNAWEWTRSWYGPYPESTYENENYGERFKVIRGNSYSEPGHFSPQDLTMVVSQMSRVNYRFSFNPTGRFKDSGVRCVKDAQ